MPLMGPDKNYADERAEKAYLDIMYVLKEKYNIVDDAKDMMLFEKPYLKSLETLKESLKEVFWQDACDRF